MDFSRPLLTVTSAVDGDVLTALALADAWFTVTRLSAVTARWSKDGVRKSLTRLVEQGVVETEPAGPSVLYRLNREHLASGSIVQLANLRSAFLSRLTADVESWSTSPKVTILFGSAARGTMTTSSDIDLFLVRRTTAPEDQVWEANVYRLQLLASRWTGNDVRVLQMTESHVRDHAGSEPVLRDIVSEGVRISGDFDWLRRLVTRARLDQPAR